MEGGLGGDDYATPNDITTSAHKTPPFYSTRPERTITVLGVQHAHFGGHLRRIITKCSGFPSTMDTQHCPFL